jgi:peroxiredoxin
MLIRLFVLFAFVFSAPPASAALIGEAAPAFTATDSNGKSVSLSDYAGKVVVLEWTNHECPFVKKHYGAQNMQNTQKRAAADGAVWLTVISSAPGKQGHVDASAANKLTEERGAAPDAVLLDPSGDIGRLYEAKTTPHMYVIDRNGILVYQGAIDSIPSSDPEDIAKAENYVISALDALKAGNKVTTTVTPSYGCGIKY